MPIRDVIVLVFFLGSLPICFLRPFYGILLWTVVAFLNPQRYTWDFAYAFPLAMAVAIPTLIGFPIFSRNWGQLRSREFHLIVALWIWFTITTIVSVNTPLFMHHTLDTWYRWEFVSKILLMTGVTIALVNNLDRLRIFVLVIAGCFGLMVLKTLPFMILTGGQFRLYGPEESMLGDNNDFGLALTMILPLFYFLAQTESNRWVKGLFAFLFLITIPAIFFTYSRGAFVGVVAMLGVMFLQSRKKVLLAPAIVIGLVIALVLAPEAWRTRMDPTREGAIDLSAQSRLNAWTFSYRLAKESPVVGGGFATFTPELYERYAVNVMDVKGPHSIYFGVMAEHGFVGLLLYLGLVLSCFASTHRLVKQARYLGDQLIAGYAKMFQLSLVGFLVSGAFLGRAYFDFFFSIVACIGILTHLARQKWAEESYVASEGDLDPVEEETLEHPAGYVLER